MPHMKIAFFWVALMTVSTVPLVVLAQETHADPFVNDSTLVRNIFDEVLASGEAHEQLRILCKDIGHRLSGSMGADKAMTWGRDVMRTYGVDTTYIMPVDVPAWTRGNLADGEARLADGTSLNLRITALGGSVPTPDDQYIEGPLLVVRHLDALDTLDARGHIVLFNRAMDPLLINTGAAYGGAFDQRGGGAAAAAKAGAIGVLVRSLTHALDTLPHTGSLRYDESLPKIPAAAVSTVDASRLAKLSKGAASPLVVRFRLNSRDLGSVTQGNVVGEWVGTEWPDQIIRWEAPRYGHWQAPTDGAVVHTLRTET